MSRDTDPKIGNSFSGRECEKNQPSKHTKFLHETIGKEEHQNVPHKEQLQENDDMVNIWPQICPVNKKLISFLIKQCPLKI